MRTDSNGLGISYADLAPDTAPVTHSLNAVILAAGRGSRLKRDTTIRPKCLADVGGRTLIQHQITWLTRMGVKRIFVVAGYRAEQVYTAVGDQAAVTKNQLWRSSNSLYSLWLTRHWISGPLLVLNCDVLMHPEILERLLISGGDAFAFDSSSGQDDEHMKVHIIDDRLLAMSKKLPLHRVAGENVGLLYFDAATTPLLYREAETVLRTRGRTVWLADAVERVAQARRIRGVDVRDLPWVEIDYQEDLEHARNATWPAICARASGAEHDAERGRATDWNWRSTRDQGQGVAKQLRQAC